MNSSDGAKPGGGKQQAVRREVAGANLSTPAVPSPLFPALDSAPHLPTTYYLRGCCSFPSPGVRMTSVNKSRAVEWRPMERLVRRFRTHTDADKATREYHSHLSPSERLEILFQFRSLGRKEEDATSGRLARVYRIAQLKRG